MSLAKEVDEVGSDGKQAAARRGLAKGLPAEGPFRRGRAGRVARRLARPVLRPVRVVQRELDDALAGAVLEVREKADALDERLSEVVAGMDVGSVPARETHYLGHPFVYPYDSSIGETIDSGREWDAVLRTIASELLPDEEPTICEVGSNIGASLRQILKGKPRARVVAFEPCGRFRPFLQRNLELAGASEVEVIPQAVGSKRGSMWLYKYNTTASVANVAHLGVEPLGRELVEVTTLDDVFRHRGPVSLIKIDADGLDFGVLRGAEGTLARDGPVVHFELVPYTLDEFRSYVPVEGLGWLQGTGYRRLTCFQPNGEVIETTEDPAQVIAWAEQHGYCDVLSCPAGSAYEAHVAGVKFVSP